MRCLARHSIGALRECSVRDCRYWTTVYPAHPHAASSPHRNSLSYALPFGDGSEADRLELRSPGTHTTGYAGVNPNRRARYLPSPILVLWQEPDEPHHRTYRLLPGSGE
jgi:hypothetical protein